MKLLSVHDTFFYTDGEYIYSNKIDYYMLLQFLDYFDEIIVIAFKGEKKEHFIKYKNDRIILNCVNKVRGINLTSHNNKELKNKLSEVICNIDIVYSRGFNGLIASKIAKRHGKKVFVFVGGCIKDSLINHGSFLRKVLAYPIMFLYKKQIRNADLVLYVAKYLIKRYPTNGKSIIWSEAELSFSATQPRISENKKITRKLGLIGYYYNEIKGVKTAIKALYFLHNNNNYELHILGEGTPSKYSNLVRKKGLTNLVFFDNVVSTKEEVMEWLDTIDIYLQPSLTEGLPKTILEAVSRGLPVIASRVGGIPDIIQKDFLHKPKDYKNLAKLIDHIANNPILYKNNATSSIKNARYYDFRKLKSNLDEGMYYLINN